MSTTNTAELKPLPCPFCGSNMDSFAGLFEDAFASSNRRFMINCDCGVLGPEAKSMEEAIAAWNRRSAAQEEPSKAAYECDGQCFKCECGRMGGDPSKETDLSKRLRVIAAAVPPNDPAMLTPKFVIEVANEIERYYGGMMAWKATAEAKDAATASSAGNQAGSAEQVSEREALQAIVNGDARKIKKLEKCEHGRYGYEECESCIIEFAQAALSAPAIKESLTTAPERKVMDMELPPLPEPPILGSSRFGSIFRGFTADQMREYALAALNQQGEQTAPEGWIHDVAQYLYGLLDDIDTASDAAKSNNQYYRNMVEEIQAKKRNVVAECDGYTVKFKPAAAPSTAISEE